MCNRQELKSTGWVDPAKIAIAGGSYGGFLTLMCLGKHPDLFRAGVDLFGVINWYTMAVNKEGGLHEYLLSRLDDPVRDKTVYDASSPMTYAKNIRAPLLILQGENENAADSLKRLVEWLDKHVKGQP